MEPVEMKILVEETGRTWRALGKIIYGTTEKEESSLKFRWSIYAVKNIKQGEEFTTENIRIIRPGFGWNPNIMVACSLIAL